WHDHGKAEEYLERVGTLPARLAGEAMVREVLPATARRAADFGCGDGRLAAIVLDACPDLEHLVAVDRAAPMLEKARARFAGDERVEVKELDLTTGIAPLGRFDAIVTGFAVHHLDDDRKRTILTEIANQLEPGGVFANLEVIKSATPELHA